MSNVSKSIWLLTAAVLIFSILVSAKFLFAHKFATDSAGLTGLLKTNGTVDYLFIGSSHTRMSYDIQRFESITSSKAFLVAYNGLSYYYIFPLLDYILNQTDIEIKNIVIENYIVTALSNPKIQDKNFFFAAPPILKARILSLLRNSQIGLHWDDYFELVISSKNQTILTYPISNYFISKMFYNGSYQNRVTSNLNENEFKNLKPPFNQRYHQIDSIQAGSLDKIFLLLRDSNVQATFVETPMPITIENDKIYKHNKAILADLIVKNGFEYIDGAINFQTADNKNFLDIGHLSTTGRSKFTQQFAYRIQKLRRNVTQ